jgi:hypothetical protein
VVAVGPEGGWSSDELASGLPTVGFGLSVLRAETAAVTAGALMVSLRTGTVAPVARILLVADETEWLGTKEASARLGITLRSLYRFIDEGTWRPISSDG